jgi:hypothetical protein
LNGAIDGNGNVFVCGYTYSKNYPSTAGSWNPNHQGEHDYNRNAFISKLNPDLSALLASTFISDEDGSTASAVAIDSQNKVIIAGTSDNPIPEVGPQFQTDCEGTILIKFNNTLSSAEATNSIGKDGGSLGPSALLIDSNGDILGTNSLFYDSHFFITTVGCYQSQKMGGDEAYVFKLNSTISGFRGATYFGAHHDDVSYGLTTDQFNNIYICGTTKSNDLPVTPGAYDATGPEIINNQLRTDCFVAKFNSNLTELSASTFLGIENFDDYSYTMTIDEFDHPIIFGRMGEGMMTFCNSFQLYGPGSYIVNMTPDLSEIQTSTYIRGSSTYDRAESITLDNEGNILICGRTSSTDFPVLNAYCDTKKDGYDVFVSKITPDLRHKLPCCTRLNYPAQDETGVLPNTLLGWNEALNASGYYLTVGTENDQAGILDQMDVGNVLNYPISGLPCDEKIYVTVDAYNENGIANGQDCSSTSFYTVPPVFSEYFDTICEGEILYWEGFPLYYEGRFRVLYDAQNGCDSILQMNLTVIPSFYDLTFDTICSGESMLWFGHLYTEEDIYYQAFTSANGCDSIYALDLTVLPISETEIERTLCEGQAFLWEGMELTEAGEYTVAYQTSEGCDSIIRLQLESAPAYSFFETYDLCESDSFDWHGQTISDEGSYFANYNTLMGCDSNYLLEVIALPEYEFYENHILCEGENLEWQGMVYEAGGTYSAIYETVFGCDSTYYLQLETAPAYHFEEELALCPDETLNWQGMEFSVPGNYEASYQSILGCDSIYYLTLSALEIDRSVTNQGDTLYATVQEGAHYQWLRCPDMTPISGATDPVYVAQESGSFAVQIDVAECSVISECLAIIHSSTGSFTTFSWLIYPNPSRNGLVSVELPVDHVGYVLRIFDRNGILVRQEELNDRFNPLNLDELTSGFYLAVLSKGTISQAKKLLIFQY